MNQNKLRKIIEQYITHYNCDDDTWYGCPKSSSGCADESQGDECNCGRDKKVKRMVTALNELSLTEGQLALAIDYQMCEDGISFTLPENISYLKYCAKLAKAIISVRNQKRGIA